MDVDEDPFISNKFNRGDPKDTSGGMSYMMTWLNIGLKKSHEQLQEMNQAQPLSYSQNSVKHGLFQTTTMKFSKIFISIIFIFFCLFSANEVSNYDRETDHKLVKKSSVIIKD